MKQFAILAAMFLACLGPSSALSADWDSCADDLDHLRRAARDATDAAHAVKSRADDFENCKRSPDTHDFVRDRCRSKAADYQNALGNLKSELSTVDSLIRKISSSCGRDLSSIGTTSTRPSGE